MKIKARWALRSKKRIKLRHPPLRRPSKSTSASPTTVKKVKTTKQRTHQFFQFFQKADQTIKNQFKREFIRHRRATLINFRKSGSSSFAMALVLGDLRGGKNKIHIFLPKKALLTTKEIIKKVKKLIVREKSPLKK